MLILVELFAKKSKSREPSLRSRRKTRRGTNIDVSLLAIHWEDALSGAVYISVVERFSEIVLYDEKGIFFNTTTEMRRVTNRFSSNGSKLCVTLSGGYEAFHTFFPFVCTQSDIRSIVDREKFLTIYPSVVLDNQLYLGKSSSRPSMSSSRSSFRNRPSGHELESRS